MHDEGPPHFLRTVRLSVNSGQDAEAQSTGFLAVKHPNRLSQNGEFTATKEVASGRLCCHKMANLQQQERLPAADTIHRHQSNMSFVSVSVR
jgi:hypothetical protein